MTLSLHLLDSYRFTHVYENISLKAALPIYVKFMQDVEMMYVSNSTSAF